MMCVMTGKAEYERLIDWCNICRLGDSTFDDCETCPICKLTEEYERFSRDVIYEQEMIRLNNDIDDALERMRSLEINETKDNDLIQVLQ